jgi:putative transposase
MPRLVCYYHAIWATKHRAAIITPSLEKVIFTTIQKTSDDLNSPILAMNGWLDHIHIAVQIHHTLSISEWIKRVKGASARAANVQAQALDEAFHWQIGYSVQTFGYERLSTIIAYIDQQKTHHQNQTLLAQFEKLDENGK